MGSVVEFDMRKDEADEETWDFERVFCRGRD
jgi:hypothetical protein